MQLKAIALISGGLDGVLAARIVKDTGINIQGICFKIPFEFRDTTSLAEQEGSIERLSRQIGIDIRRVSLEQELLALVRDPDHGYGSNVNPCIDCKISMFKKAKEIMAEEGASFMVSGEVLGQRPMSSNRATLSLIERKAQVEGLLLRPLSGRLLDETIAEKNNWIKRQDLFGFSGRSRRPQIELAGRLGITEFKQPGGGCLLTDPLFSARMRDLLEFGPYDLENVRLLKYGRHFRISKSSKLIVGRDLAENHILESSAKEGDYLFMPDEFTAGPSCLGRGELSEENISLCAAIAARYFDKKTDKDIAVCFHRIPQGPKAINVTQAAQETIEKYRL